MSDPFDDDALAAALRRRAEQLAGDVQPSAPSATSADVPPAGGSDGP